MHPSIASHRQSSPFSASYSCKPCSQSFSKTPAWAHSWKRRWAELLEQIPVADSAPHWQPVRKTKKMASIALRSATRGLWQPRGWGLWGGNNGPRRCHRASGMRQPSSTTGAEAPFVRARSSFMGAVPFVAALQLLLWEPFPYWDAFLS
jgi:hypothetical protein